MLCNVLINIIIVWTIVVICVNKFNKTIIYANLMVNVKFYLAKIIKQLEKLKVMNVQI